MKTDATLPYSRASQMPINTVSNLNISAHFGSLFYPCSCHIKLTTAADACFLLCALSNHNNQTIENPKISSTKNNPTITRRTHKSQRRDLTRFGLNAYVLGAINGEIYIQEDDYNSSLVLSLIHISEPTRQAEISYAVFCLKKRTDLKKMNSISDEGKHASAAVVSLM